MNITIRSFNLAYVHGHGRGSARTTCTVQAGRTLPLNKMKNNGRAERRRDWFRPMASSVSALSSIVANGLQILPSFPPPPLLTSRNALTGTRANSTRLRIGWTRTLFQLRTLRNLLRMQRPHPRSKGPNERPAVAAGTALCLHIDKGVNP